MDPMSEYESKGAMRVHARCACRGFSLDIEWPTAELPKAYSVCMCNSCRHATGALGASAVTLPPKQTIDPKKLNLQAYKSSEYMVRWFCSTCGAHAFFEEINGRGWMISTALLEGVDADFDISRIIWVSDTVDGGLSTWIKELKSLKDENGDLSIWAEGEKGSRSGFEFPEGPTMTGEASLPVQDSFGGKLHASCLCGGFKFYINRPNATSAAIHSPWPDLIKPYHSESSDNPDNVAWWLRSNNTKYLAGTCVCPSCVLSLGFEVQAWAFIPRCNVFFENGSPLDLSPNSKTDTGSLKEYYSSDGVFREFCSDCGATAFWHCEARPDLIDVSVGLLESKLGARAEDWLEWWSDRVSFSELAGSKKLTSVLEKGLRTASEAKTS